jgi:hypothetical protein
LNVLKIAKVGLQKANGKAEDIEGCHGSGC